MPLLIKGLQKTSLVDFPPYTVAIVFLPYCNFRCPYCHNRDLVLNYDELPTITEEEVLSFLDSRKGWLDGISFTGGEPLMHKEIVPFIQKLKEKGLVVKVDTNGTNPELLKELYDKKLVDFIAMDIKAPFEKYEDVVKMKVDIEKIKKSVGLIRNSGVDYEFRITVVPKLTSREDLLKIGEQLKGSKRFFIQQFRAQMGTLDKSYETEKSYSLNELKGFVEMLKPYFDEVELRT